MCANKHKQQRYRQLSLQAVNARLQISFTGCHVFYFSVVQPAFDPELNQLALGISDIIAHYMARPKMGLRHETLKG
jgi:hypothetical protein